MQRYFDNYPEAHTTAWAMFCIAFIISVIYAVIVAVHLWFMWNPHDYDCSRHNGPQVTTYGSSKYACQDGYVID
jgi:hypothetical protein